MLSALRTMYLDRLQRQLGDFCHPLRELPGAELESGKSQISAWQQMQSTRKPAGLHWHFSHRLESHGLGEAKAEAEMSTTTGIPSASLSAQMLCNCGDGCRDPFRIDTLAMAVIAMGARKELDEM